MKKAQKSTLPTDHSNIKIFKGYNASTHRKKLKITEHFVVPWELK